MDPFVPIHDRRLAEAVRAACARAALDAYERAAADGLCDEGALEVAIDAIRVLDIDAILAMLQASQSD
jgi:hypothetical protein